MKIIDISDEIWRDIGQPDDTSVGAINFWVRGHIGDLNALILTDYTLDSEDEFSPEFGENEKAIMKALYMVFYYEKQIRRHLGAAGTETFIEVQSDGARVRRTNKTEIAKTYLQAKSGADTMLRDLVNGYKGNNSAPRAIAGDDYIGNSTIQYKYNFRNSGGH